MMTLNEAEKVVKDSKGIIYDCYEEFIDLYLFYDNQELLTDGGWNAPVVVEKASGKMWNLNSFELKFPKLLDETKFVTTGLVA